MPGSLGAAEEFVHVCGFVSEMGWTVSGDSRLVVPLSDVEFPGQIPHKA